ncbi:MerR family transcriptional regulator [Pseudomonas fontis]|uniref:MerR family transcriptional regulator n=1 Tax=Pseudomonas fontis TaxID=2942633 RepID=A0ABT5NT34_9PSED|nr:MerR family transcriptional regulator [Pseudomonas fontis]MDD0975165.1 MerR family transcriptional regulator [Pseudomonas fontis]MDD0991293.1 MerR family transcriptional regulator [Pseudomonas fontis]
MYIGKAAQLSGATIKSIRHYETIGLLPPAKREGKYRVYDHDTVNLLALIKCAQTLGFTLKEMQALMLAGPETGTLNEKIRAALANKSGQLRERIANLEQQLADLHAFDLSLLSRPDVCHL